MNADLSRVRVQTDNTEKVGLRSGYIFIQKRNFEIQKGGRTEIINWTLIQTQTQATSQHTQVILWHTNQTNFNSTPLTSWKKPIAPGLKEILQKQRIGLFPGQERKTKKRATKKEMLFKILTPYVIQIIQ